MSYTRNVHHAMGAGQLPSHASSVMKSSTPRPPPDLRRNLLREPALLHLTQPPPCHWWRHVHHSRRSHQCYCGPTAPPSIAVSDRHLPPSQGVASVPLSPMARTSHDSLAEVFLVPTMAWFRCLPAALTTGAAGWALPRQWEESRSSPATCRATMLSENARLRFRGDAGGYGGAAPRGATRSRWHR